LAKPTEEELDLLADVGQVSKSVISIRNESAFLFDLLGNLSYSEYDSQRLQKMARLSPFAEAKEACRANSNSAERKPAFMPACIVVLLIPQATLLSRSERRQWISLSIDEHQNSIRGGTKQEKKFRVSTYFGGCERNVLLAICLCIVNIIHKRAKMRKLGDPAELRNVGSRIMGRLANLAPILEVVRSQCDEVGPACRAGPRETQLEREGVDAVHPFRSRSASGTCRAVVRVGVTVAGLPAIGLPDFVLDPREPIEPGEVAGRQIELS
jgi:hypothetical protein